MSHPVRLILLPLGCGALVACGGSGGGGPRPIPVVVEGPPPSVEPPTDPEGSIGLDTYGPFTVLAVEIETELEMGDGPYYVGLEPERADVKFERRSSDGTYFITLPGLNRGALYTTGYSGSYDESGWDQVYGSSNELLDGEAEYQDVVVFLRWPRDPEQPDSQFSYTSWGRWVQTFEYEDPPENLTTGIFVYGNATDPAAIPRTGSASYSGAVVGTSNQYGIHTDIAGSVDLLFDFGAGTLAGEMNPTICFFDCVPLGTYTFIDTVYASGSTTFSGAFSFDGKATDSWFEGLFNGPSAQELMATFSAPFTAYAGTDGEMSGTMSGVWLGKRD